MSRHFASTDAQSYMRTLERRVGQLERRGKGIGSLISSSIHAGRLGDALPDCVTMITPSDTPPPDPVGDVCDIWIDTSANPPIPRMWDGEDWLKITDQDLLDALRKITHPIGIEGGEEMPPYDPNRRVGALWRDPKTGVLYYWDGNKWVRVTVGDVGHDEKVRQDIEEARQEIADTGAELDDRLRQAEQDLEAASGRIDDAEGRLGAAEAELEAAAIWIADTGAELGVRLAQAEQDLLDAEARLGDAETRLGNAEDEIADASSWIADTGAQLGTNLAAAQDMLDAAFPTGVFDVGEAIDAIVVGAGGNVITYSNITEANKPGPAPTSTEGRKSGDIHRNRNNSTYEVYAEWMLGASGTWQPVNFGDSILRSLDVGKITGGAGAFETFVTNNLTSNEAVVNDLWTNVVRSRKITTDMLIVGQGENLVVDGSFEASPDTASVHADTDAWATSSGTVQIGTFGTRHSGAWVARIRGGGRIAQKTTVEVDPGKAYRLSLWVYLIGSTSTGGGGIRVRDIDSGSEHTGGAGGNLNADFSKKGQWQEISAVWTAPADGSVKTVRLEVAFANVTDGSTSNDVYFDDFSMVSMTDSSLIVDGAVTAKKITITGDENDPDEAGLVANIASIMELDVENLVVTGTSTINEEVVNKLWADVVRSRKITTDMLMVGQGENLWPDPWFQDGEAWETPATSVQDDPSAPGGRRLTFSTGQFGGGVSDHTYYISSAYRGLSVQPGGIYRVSFKAIRGGSAPHPATVRVYVRGETTDGGATAAYVNVDLTGITYDWDNTPTCSGDLEIPENFKGEVTLGLMRVGGPYPDSALRIADVHMVRKASASLIVDGAVTAKKMTITGDPDNPDEAGLVANIASIMDLDVENLVVTGSSTLDEAVINKLWTDVVRSQKITTDMLLVGSGVNLMVDPGFNNAELNAYRNSISIGAWTEIGVSPYGGTNRMRLTNASTGVNTLELRELGNVFMPIDPGETYRIRLRAVRHSTGNATIRPAMRFRRADGTSGYVGAGAYQQIETDLTKIATAWHEWTWKAPADAVSAQVTVQVNGASSFVDVVSPSFTVSGASLIVDGTIGARHVDAESIAADVGEFVEITANQIKSGLLEASITVSGSIGTALTGHRVEMKGDSVASYDGFGFQVAEMSGYGFRTWAGLYPDNYEAFVANNGGVTLRTDPTSGIRIRTDAGASVSKGIIEFLDNSGTPNGNIQLTSTGLQMSGWSSHLRLDSQNAMVSALSAELRATNYAEINTTNRSDIYSATDPAIALRGGYIRLEGPDNPLAYQGEPTFDVVHSTVLLRGAQSNTTTAAANLNIASSRVRRSTSLASAKTMIEPLTEWAGVKALEPVTYYDKGNLERYSAALSVQDEDALDEIEHVTKWIGLTAEQAEESGSGLATYDNHGHLNGVAYERLAVALLPWLHELENRIAAIEGEA